jgi:hypothetical protein
MISRISHQLISTAIALVVLVVVLQYVVDLLSRYMGWILLAAAILLIGTLVYRKLRRL